MSVNHEGNISITIEENWWRNISCHPGKKGKPENKCMQNVSS